MKAPSRNAYFKQYRAAAREAERKQKLKRKAQNAKKEAARAVKKGKSYAAGSRSSGEVRQIVRAAAKHVETKMKKIAKTQKTHTLRISRLERKGEKHDVEHKKQRQEIKALQSGLTCQQKATRQLMDGLTCQQKATSPSEVPPAGHGLSHILRGDPESPPPLVL